MTTAKKELAGFNTRIKNFTTAMEFEKRWFRRAVERKNLEAFDKAYGFVSPDLNLRRQQWTENSKGSGGGYKRDAERLLQPAYNAIIDRFIVFCDKGPDTPEARRLIERWENLFKPESLSWQNSAAGWEHYSQRIRELGEYPVILRADTGVCRAYVLYRLLEKFARCMEPPHPVWEASETENLPSSSSNSLAPRQRLAVYGVNPCEPVGRRTALAHAVLRSIDSSLS